MEELGSLTPAPYNPRKISPTDAKNLLASIGDFGDIGGLFFNRRTGNIGGGHQRQNAYDKLGGKIEITERLDSPNSVGTVARGYVTIGDEKFSYRVVDWPEQKERLANLAANRIQGEFDDEKLSQMIFSMKDDEALPQAGFSDDEIAQIIASVAGADEDDADLTPPAKPTSRLGDMFELGDHRLVCGDALNELHFKTLTGGGVADMVFTDPPYNVDYTGGMGGDGKKHTRKRIANDKQSADKFYEFLSDVCRNLLGSVQGAFYICMGSSELHTLFRAFTGAGGHWQTYIIWAKQSFTLSRSDYQHQFEPVLYGMTEAEARKVYDAEDNQYDALPIMYGWNKHKWYGGRKQSDVWHIDRPSRSPNHPTEKPISLVARAINNSSKRGETVLDVFGGAGSTLVAAEQLQRKCWIMELDPGFCDVIIRRWEQLTGKKAKLIKNVEVKNGR